MQPYKKLNYIKRISRISRIRPITIAIAIAIVLLLVFTTNKKEPKFISSGFTIGQNPELIIKTDLSLDEIRENVIIYKTIDNATSKADIPFEVVENENGVKKVILHPPADAEPGRYQVKLKEGLLRNIEQNFSWGVLAVNTTKSVYTPDEVAFMLDTSRAYPGATYRLRLVTADTDTTLASYANYPTLTIVAKDDNDKRYSKESILTTDDTCDVTNYTCPPAVDSTGNVGINTSIAIGTDGFPVVSYYDGGTNLNLKVAKQIGLPQTGPAYFDANDSQLKYHQNISASHPQFVYNSPLFNDGLSYWLDSIGYSAVASNDSSFDSVTSAASHAPVYEFIDKHTSNTENCEITWVGKSSVAASVNNIILQIFRFGTTNAWETVSTNSTCAAGATCTIQASATGTASEYYFYRPEYDSYKREKDTNPVYWTYLARLPRRRRLHSLHRLLATQIRQVQL
ncbi:hypothetical protein KKB40_06600 [Patescibacteria group bacterium]|nr:hypothetical protein [Patescibacteria group bacterium]